MKINEIEMKKCFVVKNENLRDLQNISGNSSGFATFHNKIYYLLMIGSCNFKLCTRSKTKKKS